MKVGGTGSLGAAQGSRSSSRPAAGGFSVSAAGTTQGAAAAAPVAGPSSIPSIDALLALQSVGGPLERRRRAMGRAGRILDVLDEMKLALLGGEATNDVLFKLMTAVREQRESTDEAGLEGVLDEIETRAAVELAKLQVAA